MTNRTGPSNHGERLEELMLDHALWGLDHEESQEFEQLVDESPNPKAIRAEREAIELSSAAASLAMTSSFDTMPQGVRELVENQAFAFLAGKTDDPIATASSKPLPGPGSNGVARNGSASPSTAVDSREQPGWIPWITALAAAAIILLAIEGFRADPAPEPTVSAEVAYGVIEAKNTSIAMDWETLTPVEGRVVFDPEEQTGVMKLKGLTPNDPATSQYQLWIFDGERTHRHPVDGGVFDVDDDGEVFVRFKSRIDVRDAVAFAVTVEEPGGVVVSKRDPIAAVAGLANIRED
ncbi:MAG: anti-sigma factor [Planctomycetota bacterium]